MLVRINLLLYSVTLVLSASLGLMNLVGIQWWLGALTILLLAGSFGNSKNFPSFSFGVAILALMFVGVGFVIGSLMLVAALVLNGMIPKGESS